MTLKAVVVNLYSNSKIKCRRIISRVVKLILGCGSRRRFPPHLYHVNMCIIIFLIFKKKISCERKTLRGVWLGMVRNCDCFSCDVCPTLRGGGVGFRMRTGDWSITLSNILVGYFTLLTQSLSPNVTFDSDDQSSEC